MLRVVCWLDVSVTLGVAVRLAVDVCDKETAWLTVAELEGVKLWDGVEDAELVGDALSEGRWLCDAVAEPVGDNERDCELDGVDDCELVTVPEPLSVPCCVLLSVAVAVCEDDIVLDWLEVTS